MGVSVIRMKEVTEKGADAIPKTWSGIRLLCGRHQVMEMFAGDFHRERGVTGEGSGGAPAGPGPMHKAGTGAGDREARSIR